MDPESDREKSPIEEENPSKRARTTSELDELKGDFPRCLKQYYKSLFPFEEFHQWFSYGEVYDKDLYSRKEFSFTMLLNNNEEIYSRFNSFKDASDFKKYCTQHNPIKMDLGAVYPIAPAARKSVRPAAFFPMEKELVFDIDMTDYDDSRSCCKGANVCEKCWWYMTAAVRAVDLALREDFGFSNLLWVFSGRRGVHCWVSDARARALAPDQRSAVAEYINIARNKDGNAMKTQHPNWKRAYQSLASLFVPVILDRQGYGRGEGWKNIVTKLDPQSSKDRDLLIELSENMDHSVEQIWNEVISMGKKGRFSRPDAPQEVIMTYLYPRLDIHVSKGMNHLLKAPFCVHPKTGLVCTPFRAEESHAANPKELGWDPNAQPHIAEILLAEEDTLPRQSFQEGVQIFHEMLEGLVEEQTRHSKELNDEIEV